MFLKIASFNVTYFNVNNFSARFKCALQKKCLDLKVKLYCTYFLLCEKLYISILQYLFSRFSLWLSVVQRVCLKPSRDARILLSLLSENSKLLCQQLIRPLWTNVPKGLVHVSLSLSSCFPLQIFSSFISLQNFKANKQRKQHASSSSSSSHFKINLQVPFGYNCQ